MDWFCTPCASSLSGCTVAAHATSEDSAERARAWTDLPLIGVEDISQECGERGIVPAVTDVARLIRESGETGGASPSRRPRTSRLSSRLELSGDTDCRLQVVPGFWAVSARKVAADGPLAGTTSRCFCQLQTQRQPDRGHIRTWNSRALFCSHLATRTSRMALSAEFPVTASEATGAL